MSEFFCYYCGKRLYYDSELMLYVCETKDCEGSSDSLRKRGYE